MCPPPPRSAVPARSAARYRLGRCGARACARAVAGGRGPGRLPGVVRSHVVTGGGRGVGRAVAERLLADGDAVVVLDSDEAALGWTSAHFAGRRVIPLAGDAADEAVTGRAADLAQQAGRLAGWVNNAAVFRDAWLGAVPAAEVTGLIIANLALAVAGCGTAVRRFLAAACGGAIVSVSSHHHRHRAAGGAPGRRGARRGTSRGTGSCPAPARPARAPRGGSRRGPLPAVR